MIHPNNFWWLSWSPPPPPMPSFFKQIWVVPPLTPSKLFRDPPFWVLSYECSPLLFAQKSSDPPLKSSSATPPPPPLPQAINTDRSLTQGRLRRGRRVTTLQCRHKSFPPPRACRVSLAPKTPFPFPFKRLPRRHCVPGMHCKLTEAQQPVVSKQFIFRSYLFVTIYAFLFR